MATDTFPKEVARSSAWSIVLGVLTAAIGVFMIIYPFATAAVSTVVFGAALIVAGVAQLIFAFTSESAGGFFLKLLLGALYAIAGFVVVAFPAAGVVTLTGVLGMLLIAEGVIELITAVTAPPLGGRGWLVFSAICSFLLGVLILAQWPSSSVWAIGTLVGVGILNNGITRVVISSFVHHEARGLTPKVA